jgi:PKD repeat protein
MIAFRSRAAALALACLTMLAAACDKVPLTAPTESAITLFATASSVPANGSVELIATVTEQAGTAVQNGTVVSFTTTLGHVDPVEARTHNGKVSVRLYGDGKSGTATVTAFSGAATTGEITIPIGGAAAETIVVRAEPRNVPTSGGTVQVIAQVRDAAGNVLAGVPVTFTATAGQIATATSITDDSGEARSAFTTARRATVTARAGAQTGEVIVEVALAPTIALAVNPATPTVGQTANFTITVTLPGGTEQNPDPATTPVQRVTLDFGDGDVQTFAPFTGTTSAAHIYRSSGIKTVTATVIDVAGQQTTQTLVINVQPQNPIPVTINVSAIAPRVGDIVGFTAVVSGTTVPVVRYSWDFGDGSAPSVLTGAQTSHVFNSTGVKTITLTVTGSDGSTGTAQIQINVFP